MTRRRWALVAVGALVGCLIIAAEATALWPAAKLVLNPQRAGRIYYLPSESMLPTLAVDDRVVPMRVSEASRRGDVVVLETPHGPRIAKVVGLPGDQVAIRDGVVSINGQNAIVRNVARGPTLDDGARTMLQAERLPGEAHPHFTLDAGPSSLDSFGPRTVPAARLFLLGDNRDRAADSRFSDDEQGLGMVPVDRVIGIIAATLWSSRAKRLGTPLDALDLATARRRS